MIDLHSHILPGVDDGARTLDESLRMLRLAAEGGVRLQVLTPHVQPGRFDNALAALQARLEELQDAVLAEGIDIELRLAAEVHVGPHILALVEKDALPWLGEHRGMRTFLLEFPMTSAPVGTINLVQWLVKRKVLPVIVHPERCREFQTHPERLAPYLAAGCPLQITASSLTGQFGAEAKALARRLLQAGHVAAVATDCHNLAYRPPDLATALQTLEKLTDAATAAALVTTGPASLLG
jgi:protein-tyrosine phosphatase